MFAAFNVSHWLLLMSLLINTQVPAPRLSTSSGPHLSHMKSVHTHSHCALRLPVQPPLPPSTPCVTRVCLKNMSSADAKRLFSCQKILFTFHFYTVPQPHSGAFSSLLHFQKTCTACTCAFPLSISLSGSNLPVDLRAASNKYTLTVISTSPTLSCFREEMDLLEFG